MSNTPDYLQDYRLHMAWINRMYQFTADARQSVGPLTELRMESVQRRYRHLNHIKMSCAVKGINLPPKDPY